MQPILASFSIFHLPISISLCLVSLSFSFPLYLPCILYLSSLALSVCSLPPFAVSSGTPDGEISRGDPCGSTRHQYHRVPYCLRN